MAEGEPFKRTIALQRSRRTSLSGEPSERRTDLLTSCSKALFFFVFFVAFVIFVVLWPWVLNGLLR